MANVRKPTCIGGLEEIASLYDAFLIDQWGVIHNGKHLYNGVLETLMELAKAQKTTVILTNSSKAKLFNVKRLNDQFGISSSLYTDIVSSAQLLKDLLIARVDYPWNSFGKKVFVVADGLDSILFEGTDLELVSDVNESDLILLLSIAENQNQDDHKDWINSALKRGLTLVCPSADQLSVSPNGVSHGMASIVNDYKNRGGKAINVGKPETTVYEFCKKITPELRPSRILAIGDQIASDIVGARHFGFDAALVATGATERTFPNAKNLEDIAESALSMSDPKTLAPNWILPSLQWKNA